PATRVVTIGSDRVNSGRGSNVTSARSTALAAAISSPGPMAARAREATKRGVMRTFWKVGVVGGVVGAALLASGELQVHFRWLDNEARALDLFGKKDRAQDPSPSPETPAAGEPFWQQGSGKQAVVPHGVPNTFADLA